LFERLRRLKKRVRPRRRAAQKQIQQRRWRHRPALDRPITGRGPPGSEPPISVGAGLVALVSLAIDFRMERYRRSPSDPARSFCLQAVFKQTHHILQ
jgi:hypothetical protein